MRSIRICGGLAVLLTVALGASSASAAEAAAPPVAPQPRFVGGHIGVATSFATIGTTTDTISDRFPLVVPIGIGIHTSDNVVIDFETQVVMSIHPRGATKFNVDPGIIYNFGPAAVGLRVLFPINATAPGTNIPVAAVGAIPLINKGIADLGFGTWFVEAAFPFTVYGSTPTTNTLATLDLVLHTGIGF